MNAAVAWFARNHVASNLLMALLVVGGLFTIPTIKQEIFPEIAEHPGIFRRTVFENPLARFEHQVQPRKVGVFGLELVDDPQ